MSDQSPSTVPDVDRVLAAAVAPPPHVRDQGVPWHYGEPLREQRWLAEGRGIVDLGNRGIVAVSGADRLSWLHALTTQDVQHLAPGSSALALILDPHGHVEFELHLCDDGSTTWIIVEPGEVDALIGYLESMRFLLDVQVEDRTGPCAVVWAGSPDPADVAWWSVPEPFASRGLTGGQRIISRAALPTVMRSAIPCGTWALEALRVAALLPRQGCETDARTIPNELGWLGSAVHLNKGCYRGQETVAKVYNLGRPPRRVGLVHCSGSDERPLGHGDVVTLDGREIGWIGTGAQHFELGSVASAVLKRSVPLDAVLTVVRADGGTGECAQDPDLHT